MTTLTDTVGTIGFILFLGLVVIMTPVFEWLDKKFPRIKRREDAE